MCTNLRQKARFPSCFVTVGSLTVCQSTSVCGSTGLSERLSFLIRSLTTDSFYFVIPQTFSQFFEVKYRLVYLTIYIPHAATNFVPATGSQGQFFRSLGAHATLSALLRCVIDYIFKVSDERFMLSIYYSSVASRFDSNTMSLYLRRIFPLADVLVLPRWSRLYIIVLGSKPLE